MCIRDSSIPVLDNDNQLLGVITSASIIDLVDDEMGDDYAKLAEMCIRDRDYIVLIKI